MKDLYSGCSVSLGSLTQAQKAQRLLANAAIPTRIIKQDSSENGGKGCSYSLDFSCSQAKNIQSVFAHERIKVKQWNVN